MSASTSEPKAIRTLLLEDVDTDAQLVRHTLQREGLTGLVERVQTREAFAEALRTFAPDIILADYSLPAFDGLTALEMAQEQLPDVPVVFVSGAIGEQRAIETLKQGATDYVLKDKLSRLGPAVRRALREAEERRARREAEAALRRAHDELEQKVEERTAELRESEERLQSIIDSAVDAIINVDEALQVTLFNAAAESIFQCAADEVIGTSIEPLLTDELDALLREYVQDDPDGGRYVPASEGVHARRADGATFPVEATLAPIDLPDERRYLIILRDVDYLKQAEEELTQLRSEKMYLQEELKSEYGFSEIVGTSPPMQRVFDTIGRVAETDTTVLVTGETGTGKELVARALHDRSPRSDNVLVKVNCSALSSDLIESELFGHEKGAFTGASEQRKGRFEVADEGTLFLDEVGELPLETQAKLLRALQEQEFERVGGSRTIHVDTRILAATNRDLEEEVEAGRFRSDLFYRLNIFPIELPPLRDRREDIPLLANHFRTKFGDRMSKEIEGFSASALAVLKRYDWPGNVRELANIIERAVILTSGSLIRADDLAVAGGPTRVTNGSSEGLDTLEEAKRQHIIKALKRTDGVVGGTEGAAALLDVNRTTLHSQMERLGIDPSQYR